MILTSAAKQDKSGSCVRRQFLIFCREIAHTAMHCKKERNPLLRRVRRRRRSDRFNLGRQLLGASFGQSHFLLLSPTSPPPLPPPTLQNDLNTKEVAEDCYASKLGGSWLQSVRRPSSPLDPLFLHTHMHPFAQRRRRDGDPPPPLFPKVEGRGRFPEKREL